MLSDEKGSSNVFEAGTVKKHNLLLRIRQRRQVY